MIAALARAFFFAGILVTIGAVAFHWLVLRRATVSGVQAGDTTHVVARSGLFACVIVLCALVALFAAQLADFHDPTDPILADAALLFELTWGRAWLAQAIMAVLAAVGYALARRKPGVGWPLAGVAAVAIAFTPAFAGHAIATEPWTAVAVAADGFHVLAAGVWLGTMMLLPVGLGRLPAPNAGSVLLARLRVFSPLALTCAAVVAGTGTLAAWLHLTGIADLWRSTYGRWLTLKLLLFVVVLVLGGFNWRRATPRLAATGDAAWMRRSIRNELLFGALLVLVTAVFVASPLPGEE